MAPIPENPLAANNYDGYKFRQAVKQEVMIPIQPGMKMEFRNHKITLSGGWKAQDLCVYLSSGFDSLRLSGQLGLAPLTTWQQGWRGRFEKWGIQAEYDVITNLISLRQGETKIEIHALRTKFASGNQRIGWGNRDVTEAQQKVFGALLLLGPSDFALAAEKGLLVEEQVSCFNEKVLALPGTVLHQFDPEIPAEKTWYIIETNRTKGLFNKTDISEQISPVGVIIQVQPLKPR